MNNTLLKKVIVNVVGFFGITIFSGCLQAASFDCAKAVTKVEILICNDNILSQQDEQLAKIYKTAMSGGGDKSLKQTQRKWLSEKRNACKDAMCLMQVYHERTAQLNTYVMYSPSRADVIRQESSQLAPSPIVSSVSQQPKFTLEKGKQFQLCRDFLELMNRVPKKEDPNCGLDYPFDDVAKKQGFREIDWEEVDLKEYMDVFKNHYVYDKKDMTEDDVKKNEELFHKYIPNSKIRLWKANFDVNGDKNIDAVFKVMYKNCIAESGMVFLVRNDGVLDKKAYARTYSNQFFMYQGRAYVHATRFIWEMVGQDTYGYAKDLCQFN